MGGNDCIRACADVYGCRNGQEGGHESCGEGQRCVKEGHLSGTYIEFSD